MDNCTYLHVHFIPNHQTLDAHEGQQLFFIFVQTYTYGQTQKSSACAGDIGTLEHNFSKLGVNAKICKHCI
jgi:hypothetical protein